MASIDASSHSCGSSFLLSSADGALTVGELVNGTEEDFVPIE
jgi:hypothetical protein